MLSREVATPYINHHVFTLSEHMYEELKLVEKGIRTHQSLSFRLINHINTYRSTFYLFGVEDFVRLEKMMTFCVNRFKDGCYDNMGSKRGLLNAPNTGFLDDFDKFLRKILEERIIKEKDL